MKKTLLARVIGGLLTLALGGATFAAMLFWAVPGLDPSLWEDLSAVAALRPPQNVFPGFWRAIVWALVRGFGLETSMRLLPALGWATAALSVMLFHRIVRRLLVRSIRTSRPYAVWNRFLVPFFALVATVVFAASDPLWRVSQTLSPSGLQVLVFLTVAHLSLRWYDRVARWGIFVAFALMGLLAAESPFAFALPFAFVALHIAVWNRTEEEDVQEPDAYTFTLLPKWRIFFLFLAGLAGGALLNMYVFESLGGVAANRWAYGTAWFRYAIRYWKELLGAATPFGWLLGFCFGVLPLALGLRLAPRGLRDDQPMPFGVGVLLFFVVCLSVLQTGFHPAARFWTFAIATDAELVPNGFLLAFFVMGSIAALALGGATFAFECQRKYLSATWGQVMDEIEPEDEDREDVVRQIGMKAEMHPSTLLLKGLVPVLCVPLVIGVLRNVPRPVETEMMRIVSAAVDEIVEEAGDAQWLFSDGRLDPAIELAALRRGRQLRTLDMLSGASPWSVSLRLRGLHDVSADEKAAEIGVPVLFRTWAGEKPKGLDTSALMLGFDFWKRAKRPLPTLSGLVARTVGLSEKDAEAGVARARALSDRILALTPRMPSAEPTLALRHAYTAVSWRLSRFALLRNERMLSDSLIESSSIMKRLFGAIEAERRRVLMLMTPAEGLNLALTRTDFAEARRYATVILGYDEENLQANFAMGMSAISMNRMAEAELYLLRCHKLRPREATIVNNLSIVYRKLGRFDEAVKYAKLAVELLPNSPEAKQTLEDALNRHP